jgi:hypothetical protein
MVAFALLRTGGVSRVRVIVGLLWLLLVIAAHELSSYRPAVAAYPVSREDPVARAGQPRVDLYGNEVVEAVGDYRVDVQGEIYERHAPDTAVLRLAPPGT